jgi:hypothetical protein
MPFKPGKSGNEKGRAKGVPNNTTQQRRDAIAKIVDAVLADHEALIKEIRAIPDISKKLDVLNKLLPYIQAKPTDEQPETGSKDVAAVMEMIFNKLHPDKQNKLQKMQ